MRSAQSELYKFMANRQITYNYQGNYMWFDPITKGYVFMTVDDVTEFLKLSLNRLQEEGRVVTGSVELNGVHRDAVIFE